jgi:hypothetical protein
MLKGHPMSSIHVASSHVANLLAVLPPLPTGTIVVINTETGEFTTGPTEAKAFEAFEDRYGWGVPAYVHCVTVRAAA